MNFPAEQGEQNQHEQSSGGKISNQEQGTKVWCSSRNANLVCPVPVTEVEKLSYLVVMTHQTRKDRSLLLIFTVWKFIYLHT